MKVYWNSKSKVAKQFHKMGEPVRSSLKHRVSVTVRAFCGAPLGKSPSDGSDIRVEKQGLVRCPRCWPSQHRELSLGFNNSHVLGKVPR